MFVCREATKSQVEGTRNVLEVCKKCHRIQSLVYVSSIANWFNKTYLEEKLYSEEVSSFYKDSTSFIRMVNEMSDVQATQFSEQLVGKWPKFVPFFILLFSPLLSRFLSTSFNPSHSDSISRPMS